MHCAQISLFKQPNQKGLSHLLKSFYCHTLKSHIWFHFLCNLSYQSLEWQPLFMQFCAGLVLFDFSEGFHSPLHLSHHPVFLLLLPIYVSSPVFLLHSLFFTSPALLALTIFIFSLSAVVNVTFVLSAISTNKNRFYLLYFTTYIPTLILTVSNKFIKSGTEVEHRNQYVDRNQTNRTIHHEYLLLNQMLIHSLEHGEVSS